jgi:hypothetical protein
MQPTDVAGPGIAVGDPLDIFDPAPCRVEQRVDSRDCRISWHTSADVVSGARGRRAVDALPQADLVVGDETAVHNDAAWRGLSYSGEFRWPVGGQALCAVHRRG